jgi:hypothetical protein
LHSLTAQVIGSTVWFDELDLEEETGIPLITGFTVAEFRLAPPVGTSLPPFFPGPPRRLRDLPLFGKRGFLLSPYNDDCVRGSKWEEINISHEDTSPLVSLRRKILDTGVDLHVVIQACFLHR